jgi:hypothetical protein
MPPASTDARKSSADLQSREIDKSVAASTGPAGRPIPTDPDSMLLPAETADFLGISPRTLEAWRLRGGGPLFCKLGSRVRYRRSDLVAWSTNCQRQSTSGR